MRKKKKKTVSFYCVRVRAKLIFVSFFFSFLTFPLYGIVDDYEDEDDVMFPDQMHMG